MREEPVKQHTRGYVIKKRTISFVFFFIFAWIIAGFNTWNPDYDASMVTYNSMILSEIVNSRSMGYSLLICLFKFFGIEYQTFRIIVSFFILIAIYKCLEEYTNSPVMAFAAYLVYPFLIDAIQLKQWIAVVIVLYSLRFLKERTREGGVKYCLGILLAVFFHSSVVFYLSFIVVYFIRKPAKMFLVVLLGTGILSTMAVPFINYVNSIAFVRNLTKGQIDNYLRDVNNTANKVILFLLVAVCVAIALYIKQYGLNRISYMKSLKNGTAYEDVFTKIAIVSIIFIPFMYANQEFYRLYRGMYVLIYALFFGRNNALGKKYRMLFSLCGFLVMAFLFYKEFSSTGYYYEAVTKSMFENNMVFEWIFE